jgi:hypothetical protein
MDNPFFFETDNSEFISALSDLFNLYDIDYSISTLSDEVGCYYKISYDGESENITPQVFDDIEQLAKDIV